jgi:acetylornithine deacetylase
VNPNDARDAVASLRDELYQLAIDLVRTPSVTGLEDTAQELLAARLRDWGLDVDLWTIASEITSHRAYCDDGLPVDRKNLVARWGPETDTAALILNGHIDVVPTGEPEQWDREPFDGRIHQGALHGRGSCDMKGGLAACCIAVRAAMKLGIEPKRPILVQSVVGEETGGLGTLAAIERGYRADAAVIAEPTSLEMCPVQAGALSFRLHVPGKAAHGAMRTWGVSSIEKFWLVFQELAAFEKKRHQGFEHPFYEADQLVAPLSVGKVRAGNWPSTVPEELVAEGRFGIFPGEDCDDARRQFEDVVRSAASDDDWLSEHPVGVEWFEGQFEPGATATDAPILDELETCHRELLGNRPKIHGVSYGSDLRLFTRYADMPAVLYGPGDVALAHAANEWLPLDELVHAAEVFTLLIASRFV